MATRTSEEHATGASRALASVGTAGALRAAALPWATGSRMGAADSREANDGDSNERGARRSTLAGARLGTHRRFSLLLPCQGRQVRRGADERMTTVELATSKAD
eukprot:4148619-Prymnesium_polylepis.2